MDSSESVSRSAAEFSALLESVQQNVEQTAQHEREVSLASLEKAQGPDGVLTKAEQTRDSLERAIQNYRKFEQQLVQLEQIYMISEDLKQVVRDLRDKA